jgi:hypothetical protein
MIVGTAVMIKRFPYTRRSALAADLSAEQQRGVQSAPAGR